MYAAQACGIGLCRHTGERRGCLSLLGTHSTRLLVRTVCSEAVVVCRAVGQGRGPAVWRQDRSFSLSVRRLRRLPHDTCSHVLLLAELLQSPCGGTQAAEPALASFLHTSVLAHPSLAKAMSFMLANKLSSRTLLGTQLMRLISDAYRADPVRALVM